MPFGIPFLTKQTSTDDFADRAPARRRVLIVCILLLALVAAGIFAFRGLGRWLIREDPLAQAGVIAVLSGGIPYRAEAAAGLYRQGFASEIWLTRPDSPARQLTAIGIHFEGEEDYNREILLHDGVPASAIRVLPGIIVDTEDEIREITSAMRDSRDAGVIIVTSPPHTRRVRALWRRLAAPNQHAIIRAASPDPFDRDHWWRNTRDAFAVLREILGLLNTWTGLTVRPHSP